MFRTTLALLLLASSARTVRGAEVTLVLEGLASGDGEVQVDVFAEPHAASFPYTDRGVLFEIRRPASAGAAIALGEFAPGRYAFFAMHDANANGDLDRNLLGIPVEDYGFSNDAAGTVGPPSFDAAAVQIADRPIRILVHLAH